MGGYNCCIEPSCYFLHLLRLWFFLQKPLRVYTNRAASYLPLYSPLSLPLTPPLSLLPLPPLSSHTRTQYQELGYRYRDPELPRRPGSQSATESSWHGSLEELMVKYYETIHSRVNLYIYIPSGRSFALTRAFYNATYAVQNIFL